MLTLLLVEPHSVLRQSLRNWLEVDLAPCLILEADNLPRAFDMVLTEQPRVILLDLDTLPETADDIQRLTQLCPKAFIIGMGLDDTPSHRQRAELAGVNIFVSKSKLQTDLIRALVNIK
jgi:DNA-binding NarL/FixJ family response regulator